MVPGFGSSQPGIVKSMQVHLKVEMLVQHIYESAYVCVTSHGLRVSSKRKLERLLSQISGLGHEEISDYTLKML